MYASTYFENAMLNLMKGVNISMAGPFYLGLFLTSPGESGTDGTEITYNNYARQPIAFSNPTANGAGLMIQNTGLISFPEANSSAGTVQFVGVFDSLTAGNMLLYGGLDTGLVVQAGVSPIFRAGSIKWIWSGNLSSYYRELIMKTMQGTPNTVTGFAPYIALCNGDPTTTGSEFTGDGTDYARIAVSFTNPTKPQENGPSMIQNTADVLSNISTSSWGNLTHVAIYDNSSGGHAFAVMSLGRTYNITLGTAVGFHAGDLKFNVN